MSLKLTIRHNSYSSLQRAAILIEVEWAPSLLLEEWATGSNGLVLEGAAASFLEVGAVG